MTDTKCPGVTHNVGSANLGRRMILFETNSNDERPFSVHEDLICATSNFFKEALQNVRKPRGGECPICHEQLNPNKNDIAFCSGSCGQNIHEKCIRQWLKTTGSRSTCPMCRKPWKTASERLVKLKEELDSEAVQLYTDWLYTRELRIDGAIDRASDEYNVLLLKAWTVSEAVDDMTFLQAIANEHILSLEENANEGFRLDAVKYAYREGSSPEMKLFVSSSFHANYSCLDQFERSIEDFPDRFVRDLCMIGMRVIRGGAKQQPLDNWVDWVESWEN